MELVYVIQTLGKDGTALGSPLAVFGELEKAEHFISDKYTYEFLGINASLGYIYENAYGQRLVISTEVVRQR